MKTDVRDKPVPKLDSLGRERRLATLKDFEVRSPLEEDAGGSIGFKGHAAIFDSKTLIQGWFMDWTEEIARGAFRKTISEADVRFLINHNADLLLARNRAGTLRLEEDEVGLATDADMAPTSYAKDLAISLERKDISQMSFAFEIVKEEWDYDVDPIHRKITEVKLWDVAVVTYPAYTETDASLRSAGFEMLCRSMDLDAEARTQLLRQVSQGHVEPEFAPTLEAAGEALRRLARSNEPAESHSLDVYQRRHSLIARKYDLERISA